MGASWIHGTTNNPLLELASKAQTQLVATDYSHGANLVVAPFHQFLGPDAGLWAQWFTMPIAAGPIMLAFNAGHRARSAEAASPDDLVAGVLPIAHQLFGENITPVQVRTSNWTIGPFALGSYSFHTPDSGLDDRRQLQEPISDRLYLAGEAVGVNNAATAHGTLLSGRHAAVELMRRLGG